MSSITKGTKGFVHLRDGSYLSHVYRPVTVTEADDKFIGITPDAADRDPYAKPHVVFADSRSLVTAPSQRLILEGEPGWDRAVARWEYDTLVAETARTVGRWGYDTSNPGLALQASEALRVLASTPEPPKD